jgi:hypothetical protein
MELLDSGAWPFGIKGLSNTDVPIPVTARSKAWV